LATAISPQLDQNLINGIQIPRLAPDVIGKIAFDPEFPRAFRIRWRGECGETLQPAYAGVLHIGGTGRFRQRKLRNREEGTDMGMSSFGGAI